MYSHNLLLERAQRALIDGFSVFVAVLLAVWVRHYSGLIFPVVPAPWSHYLFPAIAIASMTILVLFLAGSYSERGRVGPSAVDLGAIGAATVVALTASFFIRDVSYSRLTVLIFPPLAVLVMTAMRYVHQRYVESVWETQAATQSVLIVGRTPSGIQLEKALTDQPAFYKIVGFLDDESGDDGAGASARVIGRLAALGATLDDGGIDEVMICLPNDPDGVIDAIGECMRHKVTWRAVPNMYGLRLDRVSLDSFGGVPMVGSNGTHLVGFNWSQKRAFDVAVASVALVMLSPLFLVVAVAIRLTSSGPVLFRQTRVGLGGETFTMLKFRSMRTGSSTDIHSEYAQKWIYGRTGTDGGDEISDDQLSVHKMTNDPRITSVGRWIRAASLDELPQFWNVLRGDMSIVGPRPALPYEVERYTEWHKRRLAVPPGITGSWQVSGRNDIGFEDMVALDVDYIEHWSFDRDVALLLKTVPAVLKFGGK